MDLTTWEDDGGSVNSETISPASQSGSMMPSSNRHFVQYGPSEKTPEEIFAIIDQGRQPDLPSRVNEDRWVREPLPDDPNIVVCRVFLEGREWIDRMGMAAYDILTTLGELRDTPGWGFGPDCCEIGCDDGHSHDASMFGPGPGQVPIAQRGDGVITWVVRHPDTEDIAELSWRQPRKLY